MTSATHSVNPVRISGPADLVALMPHQVGFQPSESVVVMCLHGSRRRSGLVMRHDLLPEAEAALVENLAAHVRRSGATAVVIVVYTEAPDDGGPPGRGFARALGEAVGVDVLEALLVRGGRWWNYRCDAPCCPPGGTPIPERPGGPVGRAVAELALEGRATLPDRKALERSVVPSANAVAVAARAQARGRAEAAVAAELCGGGLVAARRQTMSALDEVARRWGAGGAGCEPSADEAARVVVGLRDKLARDHAAALHLDASAEIPVGAYLALLTRLCREADPPVAAPVCTVLAWVAYMQGDGALANVALDRALACEPGYSMAELLATCLEGQIPPDEVRRITRRGTLG